MCPRPARSWCEGSSIRPITHGHYPTLEEQQELGVRLRLRLREGLWSRESRCAAWARLAGVRARARRAWACARVRGVRGRARACAACAGVVQASA